MPAVEVDGGPMVAGSSRMSNGGALVYWLELLVGPIASVGSCGCCGCCG